MKTVQLLVRIGFSILMLAIVVLLAGVLPTTAQAGQPNCGELAECGYILAHNQVSAAPHCDQLAECGYILMHNQAPYQQVYVTGQYAHYRLPDTTPGIPVTGSVLAPSIACADPAAESLYVGLGYHLLFEPCGTFMTYGQ